MASSRPVQFANFICRFGDELELLDLAVEVVIPAFLDKTLKRTYTDTTYLLNSVRLLNFGSAGSPKIAIAGRFIKDTLLKREQILNHDQELIRNKAQIESSPSAIFLLMLDTHKLVYYPEVSGAPSFNTFKSTLSSFLKIKHKTYLNKIRKNRLEEVTKADNGSTTWAAILNEYPRPTLEIVPLASEASLEEFVKRFDKLTSLTIRLVTPNNELDNSEFFEDMRDNQKALRATTAKLTYLAPSGLNKPNVLRHATGRLYAVSCGT